jgi:ArsR family transcriptional regulator
MNSVDFAKALGDETRQKIMALCCCRQLSVSEIVAQLGVTQPTVSHHLKVLRDAGLVKREKRGKEVFYTLIQEKMARGCCMVAEEFAPDIDIKSVETR